MTDRDEIPAERLIAAIDDQIATLTVELEAERRRLAEERARVETALQGLRRINDVLAARRSKPWWRWRAGSRALPYAGGARPGEILSDSNADRGETRLLTGR